VGQAAAPIGNYTVWPIREGLRRASQRFSVELKGTYTTHRFIWNPNSVTFQSLHGHHDDNSNQFENWRYQPDEPRSYISHEAMPVEINFGFSRDSPREMVSRLNSSFAHSGSPRLPKRRRTSRQANSTGVPFGLWYRDRRFAISYAEWLAREVETAEIRVYNRDGSLVESRTISKAGQPEHRPPQ
jgi:hypothetical protein